MTFTPTKLDGVWLIETDVLNDERGAFIKVVHQKLFAQHGLRTDFQESYYSISKKNVIRGMHFQAPPQDHAKLVYVTAGAMTDVVLDIRQGSPTFGEYMSFELSPVHRQVVYIAPGLAHGFIARQNNTYVTYLQTTTYSKDHDHGVRVDSFGFDWDCAQPILSARDKAFPTLKELQSPFTFSPTRS